MVLATWWGWGDAASIGLAVVLAFFFGYLLTFVGVRRSGLGVGAAVKVARAADTVSILVMEIVDNAFLLAVPGAMAAGLDSALFWWSLALALAIAFVITVPVNHWMIGRGRGQAWSTRCTTRTTESPYHLGMKKRLVLAVPLLLAAVAASACAPADDADDGNDTAADPTPTAADQCERENLPLKTDGTLTIGTDSPAYEPWFSDNDPGNGKGFESAVAYAVAEQLGFSADEVTWVKVPFNSSYKPGAKDFDFDINQISITAERAEVVDFSDGYYQAAQAVIALDGTPIADVTSVAELADYNLGAQTGTTSLTAIREVIQPADDPAVFEDTNAAKQALMNGQVDGILADLPTAFYITAVEIPKGTIIGQFQPETGEQEEFGMLFEKGSELVPCVDEALAALREDGTLEQIEQEWLSDVVDVPELR